MCDVSGEVSIFVAFLSVSCVNVPLSWTGEFIQMDYFLVVVNDHNVWLLCSHTALRRNTLFINAEYMTNICEVCCFSISTY